MGSWSICHRSKSKRVLLQIFTVLFSESRFQHLSKKTLENCEQIVNGILFFYQAGQRQCSLAICWIKFSSYQYSSSRIKPLILKAKIKNNLKNTHTPSRSPVGFINKENNAMTVLSCKHWVLYLYFEELLLRNLHNCLHYWSQLH